MVGTPYGLVSSDTRLADVVGDHGVPEIAIGRLPVTTAQEPAAIIDKIVAYESEHPSGWMHNVLMLADNPDRARSFPSDSWLVAGLVPPGYSVESISLPDVNGSTARGLTIDAINAGVGFVNHVGHGSMEFLADEQILRKVDVAGLTNEERTPLMLFMTCAAGRFDLPAYESIGEALLLKPGGGSVATWGPTGLSVNADAVRLNEAFFTRRFVAGDQRLGDAVLNAHRQAAPLLAWPYMRHIYSVLGDPGLLLR